MKVEMAPRLRPRRGGKVEVGNVYTNPHGRPFYKVIVGIVPDSYRNRGTWNNVVMPHIDACGNTVGSSNQPMLYVTEHQDHVGVVKDMPSLKIEWLTEEDQSDAP